MFPIAPHFYLIYFAQSYPLSSYILEPTGMHSIFQQNLLFWGASKISIVFLVMDQSKMAHCPKKKKRKRKFNLEGVPDLIKMNKFLTYIPILFFFNGKIYTRFYKIVHLVLHCIFIFCKLSPIIYLFFKHSYHYKEKMWGNFIFNHQKTSNNKWDGPKNVDNRP
jgi:hypothetical protein